MAFDKKAYQRDYMREKRAQRARDKSNASEKSNENVVQMPRRRYTFDQIMDRLERLRQLKHKHVDLTLPQPPPGVAPKNAVLAMDSAVADQITWANAQFAGNTFAAIAREGLLFLGYAFLAELAQRAEYRIPTETIATEMTRKWIKFKSTVDKKKKHEREEQKDEEEEPRAGPTEPEDEPDEDGGAEDRAPLFGDPEPPEEVTEGPEEGEGEKDVEEKDIEDEKTKRIRELEDEFDRLGVRDKFKELAMQDGFYGRGHLFLDFSEVDDEVDELHGEMTSDVGDGRNEASRNKVGRNGLKRIKTVEPVWTYPTTYNAINPLRDDWYNPTTWYVMGREIHASRLLTFVGRPVPDLLKPSYMFGGLSLSQLVKPYVDLWLDTRQNIGNLVQAFSVMVLQTNLSATLQTGGEQMLERAALFNLARDNAGLMMLDKNTEDFKNVSAPLSGLDHLQAQAQEHMMSVVRIPAVKFTGIQPTGLNASSEGEIRTFYDTIAAYQESFFRPNLTRLMHFVMLSLWGEIDEDITFDFEPLWALTRKEEAEVRKIEAETADILINGCAALRPEEVREAIAADPDTPYSNIDVEDVPEPPSLEEQGLAAGGKVNIKGTQGFGGGPGGGGGKPPTSASGGEAGGDDANPFGRDARWNELDHPRAPDGRFGTKAGEHGGGERTEGGGEIIGKVEEARKELGRIFNTAEEGGTGLQAFLDKPAIAGSNYRTRVSKWLELAKSAELPIIADLFRKKLVESYRQTHANYLKKGTPEAVAKAEAIARVLAKHGHKVEVGAAPKAEEPKPPPPTKGGKVKVLLQPAEMKKAEPNERPQMETYAARVQKVADQLPDAALAMIQNVPINVVRNAERGKKYAGLYRWRGAIEMTFRYGRGWYARNEANVLTHEVAHAIDHKYNWRLGPKVAPYVDEDAKSMTAEERRRAAYWFGNNKERFAELYSLAYAPKNPEQSHTYREGITNIPRIHRSPEADPTFFGGMTRERAQKVFAKSLEYLRSLDIGNPKGPLGAFREQASSILYG